MTWVIKQRINFYLDEFRPPKIPDDLRRLLIGIAVHAVVAVLLLLGVIVNWYWQELRLSEVVDLQAAVELDVKNIEQERPPLKLDQALVTQRNEMRQELESSQRILRYLTQRELSSSHSFTTLVAGLGEQKLPGVWLKRFSFFRDGEEMSIEGYTYDPAQVSKYASTLLARDGYTERAFRFVDIRKVKDEDWLSFKLDSRQLEVNSEKATKKVVVTSNELMRNAREGRL